MALFMACGLSFEVTVAISTVILKRSNNAGRSTRAASYILVGAFIVGILLTLLDIFPKHC